MKVLLILAFYCSISHGFEESEEMPTCHFKSTAVVSDHVEVFVDTTSVFQGHLNEGISAMKKIRDDNKCFIDWDKSIHAYVYSTPTAGRIYEKATIDLQQSFKSCIKENKALREQVRRRQTAGEETTKSIR